MNHEFGFSRLYKEVGLFVVRTFKFELFFLSGILVTVFVGMVFWSYNDTPIIKAAGRELSYVLLLGILLSFCVTFVIVAEPNRFTCGVVRFFLGFCPTLCYAAIVTKTNRIARIFHQKSGNGPSVPKTKYISPTSQMIIVGILTAVEVFINIVWMTWNPPDSTFTYPDRSTKLKICKVCSMWLFTFSLFPLFALLIIVNQEEWLCNRDASLLLITTGLGHLQLHDRICLSSHPDWVLYNICHTNKKMSRRVQWDKVYRVYKLHYHHYMACIRSLVLDQYKQRYSRCNSSHFSFFEVIDIMTFNTFRLARIHLLCLCLTMR